MPLSERRQIENEMIFRRHNEHVGDELKNLDAKLAEENNHQLRWDDSIRLNFRCECSDEDCYERIPMKLSVYKRIHADRDVFIIKHDHQVQEIEKVITNRKKYSVVRKNNSTAEPGDKLNSTSISNT